MKIIAGLITKNAEHYLQQSIESYIDCVDKLIVVDDNSTDNTLDICASFGKKVKIIRGHYNRNKTKQRQVYVDHANVGDYIICPDSDEVFTQKQMDFIYYIISETDNLTFTIQHINFWKRYDKVIHGHVWDQQHQRGFKKLQNTMYSHYHYTVSLGEIKYFDYARNLGKALINNPNLKVHHYGWIKDNQHVWDKVAYYMRRDNPNCRDGNGDVIEQKVIEYTAKHPFFSNDFSHPRYGLGGLYCCGCHKKVQEFVQDYDLQHPSNISVLPNYEELGGKYEIV